MSTTVNATEKPAMKLRYATKETAPFVPGRREFFEYRDLGVTDVTNGEMRAQVMSARHSCPRGHNGNGSR